MLVMELDWGSEPGYDKCCGQNGEMARLASADLTRNRMALWKFALALYAHIENCEQVCKREWKREIDRERGVCVWGR